MSVAEVISNHDNELPTMPAESSLARGPLCHTLSKALLMSKKTLISFPPSNLITKCQLQEQNLSIFNIARDFVFN